MIYLTNKGKEMVCCTHKENDGSCIWFDPNDDSGRPTYCFDNGMCENTEDIHLCSEHSYCTEDGDAPELITHVFNDGGREKAGYKGFAGDCVVRSIAIASNRPYREVYDKLYEEAKQYSTGRSKIAKDIAKKGASPRNGVHRPVYEKYMLENGFDWTPTMQVGQGCTHNLIPNDLPNGRLVVSLSRHLSAVIDGELHDTHDCSREGTRCVYGYYTFKG